MCKDGAQILVKTVRIEVGHVNCRSSCKVSLQRRTLAEL